MKWTNGSKRDGERRFVVDGDAHLTVKLTSSGVWLFREGWGLQEGMTLTPHMLSRILTEQMHETSEGP